jgi:hypothetical protein
LNVRHRRSTNEKPWNDRQPPPLKATASRGIFSDLKLARFPTRSSLPPRDFTFYVTDPISSILQIMFGAEQSNIGCSEAASAFRKRNVVIEVKIFRRTTLHALTTIEAPGLALFLVRFKHAY